MLLLKMKGLLDHLQPVETCFSNNLKQDILAFHKRSTLPHLFSFLVFSFIFALVITFCSFLISFPFFPLPLASLPLPI